MITGAEFRTLKGVIVNQYDDIGNVKDILDKQKAMDKLTDHEKTLLGLN